MQVSLCGPRVASGSHAYESAQHSPISAYWTIGLASKKCINEEAHLLAAGIINTVTEFIVVFLPMSTVLKLSLPKRQRAIVLGLFATGFLACGAGIARIIYTWLSTSSPDHDTVWNAWAVRLVSGIELYLGIVCLLFLYSVFPYRVSAKLTISIRSVPRSPPSNHSSRLIYPISSMPTSQRYRATPAYAGVLR